MMRTGWFSVFLFWIDQGLVRLILNWNCIIIFGLSVLTNINIFPLTAQTISGIVLDEKSTQPLPFVHVWYKGTTMGTYTNRYGEFVIPKEGDTLVFSAIGYGRKEIVALGSRIEVNLKPEPLLLEEVVKFSSRLNRKKTLGYRRSGNNSLHCAIWEDYFQMYRIVIDIGKRPNPLSLSKLNLGIVDFESTGDSLVVEIFLTAGNSEIPLLGKPRVLRTSKEGLPDVEVDFLNDNIQIADDPLNIYINLIGFEDQESGMLEKGVVEWKFSTDRSVNQKTFMRRSPEIPWDQSADFFKGPVSYQNLRVWVEVMW